MLKNLKKDTDTNIIPSGYKDFLSDLKKKIKIAQLKAAVKVNQELIKLYWYIGSKIFEKQKKEGWGAKTIEKLSKDLKNHFTRIKGFSFRNLKYMVQFAKTYKDIEIGQQAVAQIPWGHNIVIMDKVKDTKERFWYVVETIKNGWSRNILEMWIDSDLYKRQGKAITNFKNVFAKAQSDLSDQTLKDPYNFDFLTLREKHDEKELEFGLLDHIQKFLLELGSGFAFVGRQVHLEVGDSDFYIDLLFYHLKLRCFIVVELKAIDFKPEHIGKLNFYLSAVDDVFKHKHDEPTIGLLLCKTKDRVVAEYALRDINKPIGIAEYSTKVEKSLDGKLKESLPTIEELEAEFSKNTKEKN